MKWALHLVAAMLVACVGATAVAQEPPTDQTEPDVEPEAASDPSPDDLPDALKNVLSRSLLRIWRYQYRGETVFYLPQSRVFSDSMSELYDRQGQLICKPDGGYFGHVDGRCPDFLTTRSAGVRVRDRAAPVND
jgi:hypothetical protein